jgi:hypothetical protein
MTLQSQMLLVKLEPEARERVFELNEPAPVLQGNK